MAPKNKFTKEEMTEAALRVVRSRGTDGLTAKTLADELGTSTQPVFTAFGSMEGVRTAVCAAAIGIYDRYTSKSSARQSMQHLQALVRPTLMCIYRITDEEADVYFRDLWLVVHSLAALIVTGDCPWSDQQIAQILTSFSVSICKAIKEIPGFAAGSFDRDAVFRAMTGE